MPTSRGADDMFVHLNPTSGVVEPYGADVQTILRGVRTPSSTYLGPACFHATVVLETNGKHYQRTPAQLGTYLRKVSGYRDVRRVSTRHRLYQHETPSGWRFCTSDQVGATPTAVRIPDARVVSWQWCLHQGATNSPSGRDDAWLCYDRDVTAALEEAWVKGEERVFDVVVHAGVTTKRVVVDRSNVLFYQEDTKTAKRRWVRRVCMDAADVQATSDAMVAACPVDVCAICLCDFSETPLLPHLTLPCSHTFHCACVAPLRAEVDATKCPLCRASF